MNRDTNTRTELYELGKYKLLERLSDGIELSSNTIVGHGHDASAMATNSKLALSASGLMLEGVHFNLTYFPLKHLGYKAVVSVLSRLYAMNATPHQVQINMGLSRRFSVENLDELMSGAKLAAQRYGVDIAGIEAVSSYTGLTLSLNALGLCDPDALVSRTGAQEHHLLCLSGRLGAAYLGLQVLERERIAFEANPHAQPQLTGYDYLLERVLKPETRRDVIDNLRQANILPSAMTLVHEGLASALLHICQRSAVGCRVYANRIPIDPQATSLAEELHIDPLTAAMNGGEDYELLFTVPMDKHEAVAALPDISVIGHITAADTGAYLVPPHGDDIRITAQGWNAIAAE